MDYDNDPDFGFENNELLPHEFQRVRYRIRRFRDVDSFTWDERKHHKEVAEHRRPCDETRHRIRLFRLGKLHAGEVERIKNLQPLNEKSIAILERIVDAEILPHNLQQKAEGVISDCGYCKVQDKHLLLHIAKSLVRLPNEGRYDIFRTWAKKRVQARRTQIKNNWRLRCKRLKKAGVA